MVCGKCKKGGPGPVGGQGGCEPRIELIVKKHTKKSEWTRPNSKSEMSTYNLGGRGVLLKIYDAGVRAEP